MVALFGNLFPKGQFGEKFSETNQIRGNGISGNDEGHGKDNQDNAASQPEGQDFPENGDSEKYGGQWFQGTENGGRRGTDVLNRQGGAEKGYGGRKNSQCHQIPPQIPRLGNT